MVLIENCSREYKKKIIPISTQKYKNGNVMEESIFDLTLNIISQKKGITTTKVNDVVRTFFVKVRGLKTENHFSIKTYI